MPKRAREVTQAEMLDWLKGHATVTGPDNTAIVDPETEQVHKLALTVAEVTVGGHTYATSMSSGHGTHLWPEYPEYAETLRRITVYLLLDRARNAIIEEINGGDSAAD